MTDRQFYFRVLLPIMSGTVISFAIVILGCWIDPENSILYFVVGYLFVNTVIALTFLINMIRVGCWMRYYG